MKRLAIALALVAVVGACKKAEQQPPAAGAADTSKMMMSDTSKAMMSDTSKMMMSDTSKHMMGDTSKATKKKP